MEQGTSTPVEHIDEHLSISAQLEPQEVSRIAQSGYRSIINNRPDFEGGPSQPTSAKLEAAAREAGLAYQHLPVPPSGHTESQARQMLELVNRLPQPVLAFCRTGRRSAALYRMGQSLE